MGCSNSTMQNAKTPRAAPMLSREKTGFVAFHIDIKNDETKDLNKDIDKILSKPLPKRLQRLEPLSGATKLTAEDLEKRLALAESKRKQSFDKRLEFTRRGSVRRIQQTDFQKTDSAKSEEIVEQNADKLQIEKQKQIQDKQQIRSERAEMVRHKVKKMRDEGFIELDSCLNEIERKDSLSNDSWSDTDNTKTKKQILSPMSSGYSSRNVSATKDESQKEAFTKPPLQKAEFFERSNKENNNIDNYKQLVHDELEWSD